MQPKITPIGKRLLLRPSQSPLKGQGLVWAPEDIVKSSNMCMVIARGKDVNPAIKVGDWVMCPIGFADRQNLTLGQDFFCYEKDIFALYRKEQVFPFGRHILILRDNQESKIGRFVIPGTHRSQSKTGTVLKLGITRDGFRVEDVQIGDYIQLTDWDESMTEVGLPDGGYGLIVHERFLLCKYPEHPAKQNQ